MTTATQTEERSNETSVTRQIQREADRAAEIFKKNPNDPRLSAIYVNIGLLGRKRLRLPLAS